MVDASMDPQSWARKQLEDADPDLLRTLLQEVLEDIMGPRSIRSATRPTASAQTSARTPATAIAVGASTPASARSTSRSRSSAPASISPTGCSRRRSVPRCRRSR